MSNPVVLPGSGTRENRTMSNFFIAHKMTQNNTLNKVHVAAAELPQLLSQNTNTFGETGNCTSRSQTLCSRKVNWKNEIVGGRARTFPSAPRWRRQRSNVYSEIVTLVPYYVIWSWCTGRWCVDCSVRFIELPGPCSLYLMWQTTQV